MTWPDTDDQIYPNFFQIMPNCLQFFFQIPSNLSQILQNLHVQPSHNGCYICALELQLRSPRRDIQI